MHLEAASLLGRSGLAQVYRQVLRQGLTIFQSEL